MQPLGVPLDLQQASFAFSNICCNLWGSPRACTKRLLLLEAAAATSGGPTGLAASVFYLQLLQPLGVPQDLQQASFAFRNTCCNLWGSPRACSKRLLLSEAAAATSGVLQGLQQASFAFRSSCCNLWRSPRTCSKHLLLSGTAAATPGDPPGHEASVFCF